MIKTLHEKIAEEVVEELKKDSAIVGIQVCGSLARGEIRPASDIDFEVTSESVDKHQFVVEFREGIKVDKSVTPLKAFLKSVETHPFLFYWSLWVKIVYDPRGILKQIRDRLESYYERHPEVVNFWTEKVDLMRMAKTKGEKPEAYQSVLDEAEIRFSEGKKVSRSFFPS